jgi:hypothetical protein
MSRCTTGMITDAGCGNGIVGGLLMIAEVKKAKDSFRCVSDLWLRRPR